MAGKSSITTIQHPLHTSSQFLFHLKIPEAEHGPTFFLVISVDFPIPLHVSFDFGNPEITVRMDMLSSLLPIMTVPKAAVNKDDELVFDQGDIRLAGELLLIGAVAKPSMPKGFFEQLFGLGIFAFDPGHIQRPLLRSVEAVFFREAGNFDGLFRVLFHDSKKTSLGHWVFPYKIYTRILFP